MEIWAIVTLTLALLVLLLVSEMPIAFALGLSGAAGLLLLQGFDYTTNILGSVPFSVTSSFTLTIIPMFILMGLFAVKAKIAEQVYAVANYACRRIPGGLGVATVMACAGFAAVSGSSIGTSATMSKLSITEMKRFGYPESLAAGVVAMAGTLGVLIPPSVMLVLYAIMTGESVAAVLAAGIVPGILSAVAFSIYIIVRAKRTIRPQREQSMSSALAEASSGSSGSSGSANVTRMAAFAERGAPIPAVHPASFRDLPMRGFVRVLILFLIVLGGIYSGIFTPTESAAMGAFAALLMLIFELRRESTRSIFEGIKDALKESAATTSMVFAVVVGSTILSMFFISARIPQAITDAVKTLEVSPVVTMGVLLLMLIPLGMFLESLSILVITVPILYPVAMSLGFDGVWLAILIVKLIEIGMVTPPVGILCFVVSGTSGIKVEQVFRGVLPLVLVDIAMLALLYFVPEITLWLPSLVNP
ncbi:TRAP transporter large permease [Arthrobacter sp.]|uniref:TRAP transporter large permease n=1 Tax=Arthrobacter sp. TaxID=1667 RepID=UPI0028122AEF|nr:TRAP transporter large permease [Arthrobacter sp.]